MSWREVRGDRGHDRRRGLWSGDGPADGAAGGLPADRDVGAWQGADPGPAGGPGHHLPYDQYGVGPGEPRRRGSRVADAVLGLALGAASSTITTALAVGAAGKHADRLYQPVEFTIRVALLLAAPCMGAVLAALFAAVVAPRRVRPAPWAIGLGVIVGPILALRLDRVRDLGTETVATFGALLVCWAVVGGALAAAATARTASRPPFGGHRSHDRLP